MHGHNNCILPLLGQIQSYVILPPHVPGLQGPSMLRSTPATPSRLVHQSARRMYDIVEEWGWPHGPILNRPSIIHNINIASAPKSIPVTRANPKGEGPRTPAIEQRAIARAPEARALPPWAVRYVARAHSQWVPESMAGPPIVGIAPPTGGHQRPPVITH